MYLQPTPQTAPETRECDLQAADHSGIRLSCCHRFHRNGIAFSPQDIHSAAFLLHSRAHRHIASASAISLQGEGFSQSKSLARRDVATYTAKDHEHGNSTEFARRLTSSRCFLQYISRQESLSNTWRMKITAAQMTSQQAKRFLRISRCTAFSRPCSFATI